MIDLSMKATQSEFGQMVGISQPAVSDLLARGVLTLDASAGVWLREYCSQLREVAAGRAAAGDLDLAAERAALARAQRERIEMQNAVTRRELAPVYLLEEVLAKAGARAARILDAIPGAVRRRLPELPSSAIDYIRGEIAKARNIAATVALADLREEEGKDATQGDSSAEPGAELAADVFEAASE